jgi:hypothetical protein
MSMDEQIRFDSSRVVNEQPADAGRELSDEDLDQVFGGLARTWPDDRATLPRPATYDRAPF